MKKILSIISSVNGLQSNTTKVVNDIVGKLKTKYPSNEVITYDLNQMKFPHINDEFWTSLISGFDSRTEEQVSLLKLSDKAIKDLNEADFIVIGTPMYNFGIPSTLKSWIDHIVRAGVTFRFNADGSVESLVHGKKVFLAISSGNIYSAGPMKAYDFTENYMRSVLGFIGIKDVTAYRVEGSAIPHLASTALSSVIESIDI